MISMTDSSESSTSDKHQATITKLYYIWYVEVKSRLKVGRKKNFFLPKVKKRVEWQKFYEAVCGRSMQTTCRFEPNCFFPLASSKKVAWGLIFHIEMRVVSRIFESYTSIESRVTRPAKFLFKCCWSIGEMSLTS